MGRTFDYYDRQLIRIPVGNQNISESDLVDYREDGYVYPPTSAVSINTTAGPSVYQALTDIQTGIPYESSPTQRNICALGNGNIAICYTGDGATATTRLNLRIASPLLGVGSSVTVSSAASIGSVRLQKMNSSLFVIVWVENVTIKFAIYNNAGTVSVAAATVATLASAGFTYWNMDVLSSGDVVIAYDLTSSRNFNLKRYNTSGVLQGSETTIESAANAIAITVYPISNGGFVVKWQRNTATNAQKFARYNSSGVLQGSVTTIYSSLYYLTFGPYENSVLELTGGNLVFLAASTTDGYPDVYVYNSSGVLVGSYDMGSSLLLLGHVPGLVKAGAGFAIASVLGASTYLSLFDSSGVPSFVLRSIDTGGSNSDATPAHAMIFSRGVAGFVVLVTSFNSGGTASLRLVCCTMTGASSGTPVSVYSGDATAIYPWAFMHPTSGIMYVTFRTGSSTNRIGAYYITRNSIAGVTVGAAVAGDTATIAQRGVYSLASGQIALVGSFDHRTNTPIGTRGQVYANSAVLHGTWPSS